MLLVIVAFECLHALDAGEVPGIATLAAVFVDLVLLEGGVADFANEHDHFYQIKLN